jgi:hypothetical protein
LHFLGFPWPNRGFSMGSGESKQKISSPTSLASRVVGNRRQPLTRTDSRGRPRSSLAELLLAEQYSNDFCLIQEKSSPFYPCWSQPLSSWPPPDGDPGLSRPPRPATLQRPGDMGGPQAKFCKEQSLRPCRAREQFDAPNHWIAGASQGKPGHDALKLVRVDPGPAGLIQPHFSRKSTCFGSISPQVGLRAGFAAQCIR